MLQISETVSMSLHDTNFFACYQQIHIEINTKNDYFCLQIIVIKTMKVIIYQANKHFQHNNIKQYTDHQIIKYIQEHRFYNPGLGDSRMLQSIKQTIKGNSSQQSCEIMYKLSQLSLYLRKETNNLIFRIYEIVLRNPKGITYKGISSKTGLEIVNISHYCCRLRKLNFVQLRQDKSEKVVSPKVIEEGQKQMKNVIEQNNSQLIKHKPFMFEQLSIIDNLWINVSGMNSYLSKGLTNEEIKEKVCKSADAKLIMKLMDNVCEASNFTKQMVSEGKVFENRYKNETKEIKEILLKKNSQKGIISKFQQRDSRPKENCLNVNLYPHITKFIGEKFPMYARNSEQFLYKFVNEQLRNYYSAKGIKSARRDCTPVKFARCIKVMNFLDEQYPQDQIEIKKYLIEEEKDLPNGVMHKRSILGILEGLVSKAILRQENEYYYPMWEARGQFLDPKLRDKRVTNKKQETVIASAKPRKKVHLSRIDKEIKSSNSKETFLMKKNTVEGYQKELIVKLLFAQFEYIVNSRLKRAFRRILFVKRGKTVVRYYEPQTHILSVLQDDNYPYISTEIFNNPTYKMYIEKLDSFIEQNGIRQEQDIKVNNDVVKMFRKCGSRSIENLRNKFGGNWKQKIEPMLQKGYLELTNEGVKLNEKIPRFFI